MYTGKCDTDMSTKKNRASGNGLCAPIHYEMSFMDNFYNDVEFSQNLLELRTHKNGMLHKTRESNPKVLMTKT